jgi:CDP-6-deoxy-D-xylo-4-hexulose-3-dehydrase
MRVNYGQTVHGEEEIAAVVETLRSSTQMGPRVRAMEARVAALFAKRHGVMVNSGSSANHLAVELLGLDAGAEVVTPALTFATTVAPIVRHGLIPAFVDVEEGTYNVDVAAIEEMIGPKTRALMIPSLIGNLPDWRRIREIADARGLVVVEDSADTLGATIEGRSTGDFSHVSTTSFYGSHVVNAAGNGGMLCVNDDALARRAKLLRSWGRTSSLFVESETVENRFGVSVDGIEYDAKFLFEALGYNLEPSEIGAAFGLVQLDRLEGNIAAREANFARHRAFFSAYEDWFVLPRQLPGSRTGWLAFPLTVRADAPFTRRELQIWLERRDIQTRPVFTGNILRQPAMKGVASRTRSGGYPAADDVMRGGVLIACHHGLDDAQIAHVHESFEAFAAEARGRRRTPAAPAPSLGRAPLARCRACDSKNLLAFLPLGDHPPANAFVPPDRRDAPQPSGPLDSTVCLDCGLIQVADRIPPDFFRHYLYVPSAAQTMHGHFDELADRLAAVAQGGLIVDIGCNDGLLLGACAAKGAGVLGVDPAENLAVRARARGIDVVTDYFGPETAARLRAEHGPAKVIVTTNTLNHVGDLRAFMRGVDTLLADDGAFVVEAPWARDLLALNAFDTIYQEHVSEFSLLSLQRLGQSVGLEITHVRRLPIHAGSLRVFFSRAGTVEPTPAVAELLALERADGMLDPAAYAEFADRVARVGDELRATLGALKAEGLRIAGYGAPAKGQTLLIHFGVGPDTLDYLVDRNPLKQGLLSPGMLIPVVGPEELARRRPDVLLVLAWNFLDEIVEQQAEFLASGGRILAPLPWPRTIGGPQAPAAARGVPPVAVSV